MRLPQDRILHIDIEYVENQVKVTAEWKGEVVRCKNCKHLYKDGECPLRTWFTHTEDDYCSYGERR